MDSQVSEKNGNRGIKCFLTLTINPDKFNLFLQPRYILFNLAVGANGGDREKSTFPIKNEIDYVRVYQEK